MEARAPRHLQGTYALTKLTRFLCLTVRYIPLLGMVAGISPAAALTITPLFDSSITGAADAAQVESAINAAISATDGLYANAGTVGIVFSQAAGNYVGKSQAADYAMTYGAYTSYLAAAASREPANTILSTAVANLPSGNKPGAGGSVILTSADARVALGLAGATGCFNGSGAYVGSCGQPYDGVVTLTTINPLDYGRTAVAGQYNATNTVEHEINEILGGGGQGSALNGIAANQPADLNSVGVLDPYRYSAPGVPSLTTAGSSTAYLSANGGVTSIVSFNQNSGSDYGDFSTGGNIQSAFGASGLSVAYNAASPEYQMLEAIGYMGVPEPDSVAVVASGLIGLWFLGRRQRQGVR